ncbi:hypothetical protein HBA54_07115 [Pelagibius litoralis]|uniref:Trypsin-like peptidase domain-containing protein n=1 Tax=Pelagibius litoralis TaxID=374515 RepID=A0A967EWU1_9PROT|nr:hypothetical protein [Pelagibius litoralis]NIA68358.1 hypothetical protein [Pelagibius litoralis]
MPISTDLLQAKQTVSTRLLRAGRRGGAVVARRCIRISSAMASAGGNVHAVGVGKKITGGVVTKETCVRIYVVQKLPASMLSPRDHLPQRIDGVVTDVIESAPAFALGQSAVKKAPPKAARATTRRSIDVAQEACSDNRQAAQRPVVAGISVAHEDVTAGTLACFCRSTLAGDDPDQILALSNNHVFADTNRAEIGDDLYQPGPADGGTAADRIATLLRYQEIVIDGQTPNRVDAAVGLMLPEIESSPTICSIGALEGMERGVEGMEVRKHGRTTGYTEGVITDEAYDALVGMDPADPNAVALFDDQLRIEVTPPFQAIGLGGDSGSLIVNRAAARAVGLFFAGPESGVYGIANQMNDVMEALDIEPI